MMAYSALEDVDCGSAYDCLNSLRLTYAPFGEFR